MAEGLTPKDFIDQRNDAMREGVKALFLMNGGGAVALLAFLQAIWTNEPALIRYVLGGLAFLMAGVALAGLVHFFRYHTSMTTQRLIGMIDRMSQPQPSFASTPDEYQAMKSATKR